MVYGLLKLMQAVYDLPNAGQGIFPPKRQGPITPVWTLHSPLHLQSAAPNAARPLANGAPNSNICAAPD
jgi:hypothetical protein